LNLGKIVFNPGHTHGANVDPNYPDYSEGTSMYELGQMLNAPLTRENYENPSMQERAERAKDLGADTYISLHSNYPIEGIIIYYSLERPEDKTIADELGTKLAEALGIEYRGAETKLYPDTDDTDYYGDIRYAIRQGISHVLLVEHGAHSELAEGTQKKLEKIAQVYKSLFFNEEAEDMKIKIVPSNPPDTCIAMLTARIAGLDKCEQSYIPDVTSNDIIVQVGGGQPKATETTKLIAGANMADTARQAIDWAELFAATGKVF
jgi:hypothetical protein